MKLRRIMLCWLPILVAALTMSLVAAAPASASTSTVCPMVMYDNPHNLPTDRCGKPIPQGKLASLNHVGWVYLNLNYCPANRMCITLHRTSTFAWYWTGTAWTRSSIRNGWVYVYPYTGQWRWAWTEASGWVAMDSGRFEIRSF